MVQDSGLEEWAKGAVRALSVWAIAYGVAVLAGAVLLLVVVGLASGELVAGSVLSGMPLAVLGIAILALPGFVVLRLALYAMKMRGLPGFALAGAAVAALPLVLEATIKAGISLDPGDGWLMAGILAAGAGAGAVYRAVERALLSGGFLA